METLLRIGLSNAVAAVLLALIVAAAACVWRRPALLHALWLLVLVKLVTPPLLWLPEPWPVSADAALASRGRQPPEIVPAITALPPGADAPRSPAADNPPSDSSEWQAVLVPAHDVEAAPTLANPPPAPAPVPTAPWWVIAAAGAWLAGSAAWYALAIYRLRRFRRLLRHAAPAPESLRQRTRRLAEKMRLRRRPAVWLVPGRVAPMLWAGGGRPCILFPSALLELVGVEGQNALLVHELAHLRRRDHWVRWLEFAAAGLYWWHPVLWFARRELREAEELCCDAWVTATLPGAGKTYAAALLETLDFLSDSPPATPVLASGVGRVADLKRRLTMIMRGTTPKSLGWRGLLAVLGTGVLMLPLLPAWARAQAEGKVERVEDAAGQVRYKLTQVHIGSDDGLEKIGTELKAAEAELEQKQTEVAVLNARVQQLRTRLQVGQAATPAKPEGVVGRLEGGRFLLEVRPEINLPAVQDLIKNLQANPPAPAVIVLDQKSGKIIMKAEEGTAQVAGKGQLIMVPIGSPGGTAGPAGGVGGAPPAADSDKRIDDLEQRLKSILDEVEKLRRERKENGPQGMKGASELNVPLMGKFFINMTSEPDNKALQQRAEAEKARLAALTAELEREAAMGEAEKRQSEAKLKQLQDEISKLKNAPAGGDSPAKP